MYFIGYNKRNVDLGGLFLMTKLVNPDETLKIVPIITGHNSIQGKPIQYLYAN